MVSEHSICHGTATQEGTLEGKLGCPDVVLPPVAHWQHVLIDMLEGRGVLTVPQGFHSQPAALV